PTRRQAGQRRTQPDSEEADHVRAQDVCERTEKGALLGQEEPFPGVRAERRVAAQEARDEEQPPQRTDLESFAQIRQHDPDRKRARDVNDERAVRELRSPALDGPGSDQIAQIRAEHRPNSYRNKLHRVSLPPQSDTPPYHEGPNG